ncbi:MAG: RlmE family RNA methyltransferase [Proteobacteria bacterium]|nr:RlmE family RNA methyltransferase [Pseudomonadota bacterium]
MRARPPGRRGAAVRVRKTGGRSTSSARWLTRQLNDPYVAEAQRRGYRSRAAFKLLELDARFRLLKPGQRVIDLGAAPGGWTQVVVAATKAAQARALARVVALDLLEMAPLAGAEVLRVDFLDPAAPAAITAALGGPADLVLSDMAAPATGHAKTDHLRIVGLAEAALAFAETVLAPGGGLVVKVFQGGSAAALLQRLRQVFTTVRHAKPPASRAESAETYVVATGFRGAAAT